MDRNGYSALVLLLAALSLTGCGGGGEDTNPSGPGQQQPATTYISLQSDTGDYIGAGKSYEYTRSNAKITVTATGGLFKVSITGDEWWTGFFKVPDSLSTLQPGTYANVARYPFHNPAVGGLEWSGEGRGCNTLTGSFTINAATYENGVLTSIDLSFEQYCESGTTALRGEIRWDVNDTTQPPGPVVPPPAGLWEPPPGAVPATGSYVYLESQPGDYIGAGGTYLYTKATATLTVNLIGNRLTVSVNGMENWSGDFQAMDTLIRLEPGYYGNLRRYPFHNPTAGGLDWFGEGRGCNTLTGWFVVDAITYNNGMLATVDLRFEQRCGTAPAALRGKIRWDVNDTTQPPGPVVPPPAGLWEPPPGVVPASGNYVYLESEAGDYIGAGKTYLYTGATATLSVTAIGNRLAISVNGTENWSGNFQAMNVLTQLEPGYYGNLQRYPFHNPTAGGLDWFGQGRGCNTLTGWFVVDAVTYTNGSLTAVDLRFEQHCEGGAPALNGKIHWTSAG